jgi:hypothetical protein
MRNEGSKTYEGVAIDATFWDVDGVRVPGLDARCPCVLLAPGEECPFSIVATVRRPVSFLLHPEGRATERQSVPVTLTGVRMSRDGLTSVRITGVAVNEQPFKIKNVIVAGVLEDGSGQMVSMGWTHGLQEDILPGGSVPFDLRVELVPFERYRLYAQAERDWR